MHISRMQRDNRMIDMERMQVEDTVDDAVVCAVDVVCGVIENDRFVEFLDIAQVANHNAGEAFVAVFQGENYRLAIGVHINQVTGKDNYLVIGHAVDMRTGDSAEYMIPVFI